jgi:hypothetical protein
MMSVLSVTEYLIIYSVPPSSVKGFNTDEWQLSLSMYYMLEDQINHLLPEEDLSTDEDDEVQSLTPKDVCPAEVQFT